MRLAAARAPTEFSMVITGEIPRLSDWKHSSCLHENSSMVQNDGLIVAMVTLTAFRVNTVPMDDFSNQTLKTVH